ncbi:putative short-chain dehydrogenases/reductase [Trichoderma reesei RUT C-30]|uniref:Putative short-chain dehydrogenases/reductase n=1 Tax=Hypocrea jecorina (strain ATCC 56765 / BCRC 32924 / NRRL 11460 / Rut C-30) TaxID=1344414 RepID=A0A024SD43_HYPJR|nr:putative short-chain dehydrogenases/reductase [Trichoderma reesei RUT C-30]
MTSWAIVGAARGIGFEYVKQLSANPNNTVFALIRSQATAGPVNELAAKRSNIKVIETDVSSLDKLNQTAESISEVTSGKLDVLIYNAYSAGTDEGKLLPPTAFHGKEDLFKRELSVNLFQVVNTVSAFLPLIEKGQQKKIIYISSGIGDIPTTRATELPNLLGYAISKAAGNILMAKYAVDLKAKGILTLSLSPGWVETDASRELSNSPEVFQWMLSSFQKLDPTVKGMISTEESVSAQLSVIDSLDEKLSGAFVSHRGNDRDWF